MNIEEIVKKFPRLAFLKSPAFQVLTKEKQDYILGCVEDALFWVEHEKKPNSLEGFKFLAATYGLVKAQKEAKAKGLEGKEREKFLKSHQELFTIFNPFGGIGKAPHSFRSTT